jgi:hypothetical protein
VVGDELPQINTLVDINWCSLKRSYRIGLRPQAGFKAQ